MRRLGVVIVLLLALSACGKDNKQPTGQVPTEGTPTSGPATSSPPSSPTPSGSPEEIIEFTVDGAGPYQLGAKLTDLQSSAGLEDVKTGAETCPQNTTARGTGTWHDIYLSFRPDGSLYLAVNRSTLIPTPSGAYLGTTLAQLKTIYAGIPGTLLTAGTTKAFLVTTISGRGILFTLDASGLVFTMAAAESNFLKTSFQKGTDFC